MTGSDDIMKELTWSSGFCLSFVLPPSSWQSARWSDIVMTDQPDCKMNGFSPGQHSFVSTTCSLSVLVPFPPAHHRCHDHDANEDDGDDVYVGDDKPSLTILALVEPSLI